MTTKPPIITFREKNPNRIPVQFFRGDTPIVPTEELALFLEIRADQAGRVVASLALTQPLESSSDLLSEQLPDDLKAGTYYVGLRQEAAGGKLTWSGVCFLQILPIGSLEKVSVQGLSLTLDESTQVLSVVVDDTPFSLMAGTLAEQAEQVALDADAVAEAKESIDDSKQHVDQVKGQIDGIKTNIDTQQSDVNQKSQLVAQNKAAVDTARQSVDTTKGLIDGIKTNIDAQQVDVNQKAQQVAQDKVDTTASKDAARISELNAASSAMAAVLAFKGAWTANTGYATGDTVYNGGNTYRRKAAGTSSATFDSSQWDIIALGGQPANGTVDMTKLAADVLALLNCFQIDPITGDLTISDKAGNIPFILHNITATLEIVDLKLFKQTTELFFKAINAVTLNGFGFAKIDGYILACTDTKANIIYGIRDDLTIVYNRAPTITPPVLPFAYADYNLLLNYSQSLGTGLTALPILSSVSKNNSLMFAGGVLFWANPAMPNQTDQLASLVPMIEQNFSATTGAGGETPTSGMINFIMSRIEKENGVRFFDQDMTLIGAATGRGNLSAEELQKGSVYYTRTIAAVVAGMARAQEAGKTFNVPFFTYTQGENNFDTARATFKALVLQIYNDFNTDIKAITGQTNDLIFSVYQPASYSTYSKYPNVPLAFLELVKENQNFVMSTPLYWLSHYATDYLHLINLSSKILGMYHGLGYKRKIVDGKDWKPLYVKSYTRQGKIVELFINVPYGPLVWDTTTVADPGNYGFQAFNASGGAESFTVSMPRKDTIRLVFVNTPGPGWKVGYGLTNGTNGFSGPLQGARGCLRDSMGLYLVHEEPGLRVPCHNWMCIQEIIL